MRIEDQALQAGQSVAALATAAVTGASSIAADGISTAWLGVPISVLLAAFCGAAGVLVFLPAMGIVRALGSVFFCALAGAYAGPIIAANIAMLHGGERLSALAIAATLQVAVPMAIEHRASIGEWIAKKFGGAS